MGREGLKKIASLCMDKTEYAKQKLEEIKGVEVKRSAPTFNEFIIRLPKDPNVVIGKMIEKGITPGFPLGRYYDDLKDYMLIAVTEKRTKREIDVFAAVLEEALWG